MIPIQTSESSGFWLGLSPQGSRDAIVKSFNLSLCGHNAILGIDNGGLQV
jgi:hypothetical protein